MSSRWDREFCNKCGTGVYPFSTKRAESDGASYCISCAEKLDGAYLAKNTCSMCARLLSGNEAKIVMPSRAYGAAKLPLVDRLICGDCNKQFASRQTGQNAASRGLLQFKLYIRKGFAKRMLSQKSA